MIKKWKLIGLSAAASAAGAYMMAKRGKNGRPQKEGGVPGSIAGKETRSGTEGLHADDTGHCQPNAGDGDAGYPGHWPYGEGHIDLPLEPEWCWDTHDETYSFTKNGITVSFDYKPGYVPYDDGMEKEDGLSLNDGNGNALCVQIQDRDSCGLDTSPSVFKADLESEGLRGSVRRIRNEAFEGCAFWLDRDDSGQYTSGIEAHDERDVVLIFAFDDKEMPEFSNLKITRGKETCHVR